MRRHPLVRAAFAAALAADLVFFGALLLATAADRALAAAAARAAATARALTTAALRAAAAARALAGATARWAAAAARAAAARTCQKNYLYKICMKTNRTKSNFKLQTSKMGPVCVVGKTGAG